MTQCLFDAGLPSTGLDQHQINIQCLLLSVDIINVSCLEYTKNPMNLNSLGHCIVPLNMKGFICHFTKCQITLSYPSGRIVRAPRKVYRTQATNELYLRQRVTHYWYPLLHQ